MTAEDLIKSYKNRIRLQDYQDYMDNQIMVDDQNPMENQYAKLLFYLGYDSRESSFCCPKHAPLEKVKRSSKTMMTFGIANLFIVIA